MAQSNINRTERQRDPAQDRSRRDLQRWEPSGSVSLANPFEFLDRMSEEMDRAFDRMFQDFGLSRRSSPFRSGSSGGASSGLWAPRIEAFQKGDQFVVRADLPGLKKDDVQVDITDDALTIRGERREERQDEREGYYHSEREYGQFARTIPLPQGAIAESAQASFRNGVLEITLQAAPSEANRGRRIEVKEESDQGAQKS